MRGFETLLFVHTSTLKHKHDRDFQNIYMCTHPLWNTNTTVTFRIYICAHIHFETQTRPWLSEYIYVHTSTLKHKHDRDFQNIYMCTHPLWNTNTTVTFRIYICAHIHFETQTRPWLSEYIYVHTSTLKHKHDRDFQNIYMCTHPLWNTNTTVALCVKTCINGQFSLGLVIYWEPDISRGYLVKDNRIIKGWCANNCYKCLPE